MDRMYELSSYVAAKSLENDMHATMENYLVDLNEYMAMEAIDAKKVMEGIQKWMRNAKQRLLEFVDNLIRRLGEMVGAFGNMLHTKDILIPDDMGKCYEEMSNVVAEMTSESADYVNDMDGYMRSLRMDATITGSDQQFISKCKKENELFKTKVKDLTEKDILKGESIDSYFARKVEPNERTFKINPSKEQRKLSAWRAKWNMMRNRIKSTGANLSMNLDFASSLASSDAEKAGFARTKAFFGELYNNAMFKVTGVLQLISHLQRYISGFIRISKVPRAKDIYHGPIVGEIPAHT